MGTVPPCSQYVWLVHSSAKGDGCIVLPMQDAGPALPSGSWWQARFRKQTWVLMFAKPWLVFPTLSQSFVGKAILKQLCMNQSF